MPRLMRVLTRKVTASLLAWRMDDRGQAAVEFALVMPIFLLLLISTVEVSRLWNIHHALTEAARQGARSASLANPLIGTDSVRSTVRNALAGAALTPDLATIQLVGVDGPSGVMTQVQLSYPFELSFLHRLSAGVVGAEMDLSASVAMRHE
jgi:Flp pilus assembly protein TadG